MISPKPPKHVYRKAFQCYSLTEPGIARPQHTIPSPAHIHGMKFSKYFAKSKTKSRAQYCARLFFYKNLFYISKFFTDLAWVWMNFFLGSTSSPIKISNVLS